MAITIHYIDEYFISHNYVMSFDALRESHTGAVIAKLLYKNLKDWNVAGKMLTITLDNVSANYKAMRDIKVEYRSSLEPSAVAAILLCQSWLRAGRRPNSRIIFPKSMNFDEAL